MSRSFTLTLCLLAASLSYAQDLSWLPPGLIHLLSPSEKQRAAASDPSSRPTLLESIWRTRDKAEFERRVAQANARFATKSTPGWQTDRGRIYIQQGSPDEIYALPKGNADSAVPQEHWRYNWNDGTSDSFEYRFADPGHNGEYRLILHAAQRSAPSLQFNAWIAEDVHYIAEIHERTAFLRLHTNEERERFIEQFWLRRDPDPATLTYEYKDEHYRRIAYANQHFAHGAISGWCLDRGRIYILHGSPDEIQTHPSAADKQFPYERWLYRGALRKSFTFRGPLLDTTQSLAERPI